MGFLRLYLALCVVGAHSNSVLPWSMHGGREAVQIFFIISGFYMQMILQGHRYRKLTYFYQSRALKILVPYFSVLLLVVFASAVSAFMGDDWLTLSRTTGLRGNFSLGPIFACLTNLTVFFQDWVMFLQQDSGHAIQFTSDALSGKNPLWEYLWIPQAWSISLELTFYLIVPLLVSRFKTSVLVGLATSLLFARLGAYMIFGFVRDPWTYRFFPFELTHFIYGMIGCRILNRFPRQTEALEPVVRAKLILAKNLMYPIIIGLLWLHVTFSIMLKPLFGSIRGGYELAALAALPLWIVIVPVLFILSRDDRFDRYVGELSYPVYLVHVTIALLCHSLVVELGVVRIWGGLTAVISIVVAVALQYFVLGPFESWRQNFIRKTSGDYI